MFPYSLLQSHAETTLSTSKFVRLLVFCLTHLLSFLWNSHASLTDCNGCKPFTLSTFLLDLFTFSVYLGLADLFDYSWVCWFTVSTSLVASDRVVLHSCWNCGRLVRAAHGCAQKRGEEKEQVCKLGRLLPSHETWSLCQHWGDHHPEISS